MKLTPLALPLGETLFDQMLGTAIESLPHLGAEAAFRQRGGFTGDVLAVEPGGA